MVNHTGPSEPELPVGVPFIVHLAYDNGSFLSTGPVDYLIKFNFGEPFLITDIKKGTFENATLVGNDSVKFHGTPIFRGENKTGVVLFTFNDGLAEKHRSAIVTTNVTVHALNETLGNLGLNQPQSPIFANSSGTFARTHLFANPGVFSSLIGAEPQTAIPNFVNNISTNVIKKNLNNLTLSEIAGTFNALSPSRANNLIKYLQPLAPSRTISNGSSIVVNSSIVDLLSVIVNLSSEVIKVGEEAYNKITPCLSLKQVKQLLNESENFPGFSVLTFLVGIKNCATHPELISMTSQSLSNFDMSYDLFRFDLTPNDIQQLRFVTVVPSTTVPGYYKIYVVGNAIYNFFGNDIVAAKTNGTARFWVR